MNDFQRIYGQWHEYAQTRNTEALINLYAGDATFESPPVPIIMNRESGMLTGRAEILLFLEEGTRRRPNELVRRYRDSTFFTAGGTLIWEYPRQTPGGNQADILEVMQLAGGKIRRHRICWGWFGTQMLIRSALAKAG